MVADFAECMATGN